VYLEFVENSKDCPTDESSVPAADDDKQWNSELQRKMELGVLKEIDNMEERVCNASLQVKKTIIENCPWHVYKLFKILKILVLPGPFSGNRTWLIDCCSFERIHRVREQLISPHDCSRALPFCYIVV
jgi:hypothetical protein